MARKEEYAAGALIGAVAAVAGAFTGYYLRRLVTESGTPDLPAALCEDAIAVGTAWAATERSCRNA